MANIDDIEKQIENIKINSDDNKNNVSKNKNSLLNGVNLKDHEINDNVKSVDYNNNNENDTMNEINKHVKNDEYCIKGNSNNNNNNNNNNLDTQINETLNLNENFEKKNEENLCSGCKKVLIKKLSCPICLKNKIFSYFCSQECFKGSWKEHQKIHENMNKENNEKEDHLKTIVKKHLSPENFDPTNRKYWVYDDHLKNFVNFKFTGDVRPWPLSKINHVPSHIERPDYAVSSIPESELIYKRKSDIYVNNEEEIQRIREACILGRKTLDYAHTLVSPGVTTDEIDRKVHEFIIKNNAYPSTLNYYKFPKSCCTSVNEIVCHGIPDYRPLKSGDIINIDISVFYKGVHSDLNETYFVGDINDVPKEGKELVETCYFSLMEAIKKCKPGMFYKNIGTLIDAYVSKKNFSVVRSYSGHGVGKLFHSNPTIPHFKKNKAVGIMKPGHVFTIEPMINQGHYSDVLWPDQWTSATSDGKLSAQFEHTLLITNNGVEILTKRTQDSPPLGFDTKDELYYN